MPPATSRCYTCLGGRCSGVAVQHVVMTAPWLKGDYRRGCAVRRAAVTAAAAAVAAAAVAAAAAGATWPTTHRARQRRRHHAYTQVAAPLIGAVATASAGVWVRRWCRKEPNDRVDTTLGAGIALAVVALAPASMGRRHSSWRRWTWTARRLPFPGQRRLRLSCEGGLGSPCDALLAHGVGSPPLAAVRCHLRGHAAGGYSLCCAVAPCSSASGCTSTA